MLGESMNLRRPSSMGSYIRLEMHVAWEVVVSEVPNRSCPQKVLGRAED